MAGSRYVSALAFLVLWVSADRESRVEAATYSVPGDFATIQAAVVAASTGDVIEVGPGTYVENIDFLSKSIALRSTMGPGVTTIDGSGLTAGADRGSTVILNEGSGNDPVLEGFTITGGSGTNGVEESLGGGIYCTIGGGTVRNCRVTQNVGQDGGGMTGWNVSGAIVLENCEFVANESTNNGGGLFTFGAGTLTMSDCTFASHTSDLGGGALVSMAEVTLTRCDFTDNVINPPFAYAGGLSLGPISVPTYGFEIDSAILTDCEFRGNTSPFGGAGMLVYRANATCIDCRFLQNTSQTGVAILLDTVTLSLENCVIARNVSVSSGVVINAGINSSSISIDHCTIVDNQCPGGLLFQGDHPVISPVLSVTNSIVHSNEDPTWVVNSGVDTTFEYSNIESFTAAAGTGIIDAEPLFIDLAGGDYRLAPGSPCIDTGDPLFPLDADGTRTDMGAFPFVDGSYFVRGDANQDGIVDLADAIHVLGTIILGIYSIECDEAADANGDDSISVADPIYVLAYRFQGGPPPAAPFPECGIGGDGLLDCVSAPGCAP